ncbi:hypothetical protein BDA99DRAFT_517170 [Phascolomyces articulosus]|uniref:Uncharacterized protein n=1 Tax=Phascolomyces articulosus TaxID=60185 RepID=A0AAD5PBM3_9FUNG|nr:hypothetical protein BDA99DRAFT_517170 [Phascolomyces articulosus]
MLKLFGPKKKKKSTNTIDIMSQNNIDDISPTIPVAAPIMVEQPSPILFMPKPRYGAPPTKDILQNHENDKTELEVPEETTEDVSPIMLPHRVRFTSSSTTHGTSPLNNNKPPASPTATKRSSIAASSEDSHRVYESALESPALSSPLLVAQQQQQQQQSNNSSCTSLEDVEALQRQVQLIQQACEQERQEWMKREHAHRLREKQMLEKITETQDQLRQALAQVQQARQQQQVQHQQDPLSLPPPPPPPQQLYQKHYRIHPPRDDSGYMEYEDEEPEDIVDVSSLYRYQQHHAALPRVRSMERPASRQHRNKRWLHRRSVSVEKPRAASEEYRRPHSRSRSRASSYYDDDDDDDDERDVYFIEDDDPESELENGMSDGWDDYYQQNTRVPPQPRPRISESTPTVQYLRPRRSYRRPRMQYHHPSYYHHYYPYDML